MKIVAKSTKKILDTKIPVFHQIKSTYQDNHTGIILLPDGKEIKTPVLWYGLSIVESVEFQKNVYSKGNVKAFLSNVYDLLFQDKKGKRATLIEEFTKQGMPHKLDSGGFQLMKANIAKDSKTKKKIKNHLTPEIVFNKQRDVGCDVAIQLDVPLSPNSTKKEQKEAIDTTIRNFKELLKLNRDNHHPLNIMPVAHGYSEEMINYCIEQYEELLDDIPIIGIGSLVPMVKSIKGTNKIGGKWTFVKNLIYLRKRLPNTMIHAFGIGGTMSYLAFYCGIDSLDSNGWIQKSAYGVIQLPGISDRFLFKKPHNRPYLMANRMYKRNGRKKIVNEIKMFMNCNCPECKPFQQNPDQKQAWIKKQAYFDKDGEEGRMIRAIHNVYVFNQELELITSAIENGTLNKFIEDRLSLGTYMKLFYYARYLKNGEIQKARNLRNNKKNGQKKLDILKDYFK